MVATGNGKRGEVAMQWIAEIGDEVVRMVNRLFAFHGVVMRYALYTVAFLVFPILSAHLEWTPMRFLGLFCWGGLLALIATATERVVARRSECKRKNDAYDYTKWLYDEKSILPPVEFKSKNPHCDAYVFGDCVAVVESENNETISIRISAKGRLPSFPEILHAVEHLGGGNWFTISGLPIVPSGDICGNSIEVRKI